ncbi:secondary thiamine-phosphate synthase enzyme YjbQ [Geoglobus sp.]
MRVLEFEMDRDEVLDITPHVQRYVEECGRNEGAVLVFSVGSTGAVTTLEYEPGLKKDLPRIMDRIAPYGEHYDHHLTWNDDNGSSHVKAAIIGPSIVVPFREKKLLLGTWQQIVLINFDTRRRKRKVVLRVL